jgi:hypothetical protein
MAEASLGHSPTNGRNAWLTAADIGRFVRGLGAGEVKVYADRLVGAAVLAGQKTGRAVRYCLPGPEAAVDRRRADNQSRAQNVYDSPYPRHVDRPQAAHRYAPGSLVLAPHRWCKDLWLVGRTH